MMAKFTKERRQEIVREFATRHNGYFNPALFVEEVRATGEEHPAYEWFEWDRDKAARQYRVWQAREFARDLKITFSVEEVGRSEAVKVRSTELPMALSPMQGRSAGGGYYLTDPDNPEHMEELCRQGARALEAWLRRYRAAVEHSGGSVASIEKQLKALQKASPERVKEAA